MSETNISKPIIVELRELKATVKVIAEKVQLVGEMCAQLKKVLVELAEEQKDCREELAEASGNIAECSWF